MEKKLLACLLITVCINSICLLLFNFLHCLLVSISSTLLACLLVLVALMHFAYLLLVYMHACLVHLHVCLINNSTSVYVHVGPNAFLYWYKCIILLYPCCIWLLFILFCKHHLKIIHGKDDKVKHEANRWYATCSLWLYCQFHKIYVIIC